MLDPIKRLGTDTAIYGVSTVLGRFLNFLLVPLYTNVLPPGEYGIAAYLFSLIAFANVVYGYGMESAFMRFSSAGEIGNEKQNFSTPFISLTVTSAVFSTLLLVTAPAIRNVIDLPVVHGDLVRYAAIILFLDALALIPFAHLRMQRKAKTFAAFKLINIVMNVGANLHFLLNMQMGVEGIFLANVIASAATLALLLPVILKNVTLQFSGYLYRTLLKFGLPYLPAGFAAIMIQVVDRPILRLLTDDATVGIYQANYRLAIFMMLLVTMFDYAWRPFFLNQARDPDAKTIFARVLTYYILGATTVFLALTLFLPDIVGMRIFGRHLIHPDYWGALGIVPIVMAGYLLLGVYNNFMAGIYIEKKTHYLPIVTIAAAATNVGTNFLLIPLIGMNGAAWATFLSYFVMAVSIYILVQRVYRVAYEWVRVSKVIVAAIVITVLFYTVAVESFTMLWKCGLFAAFIILIYATGVFQKDEVDAFQRLLRRMSRHETPPGGPSGAGTME